MTSWHGTQRLMHNTQGRHIGGTLGRGRVRVRGFGTPIWVWVWMWNTYRYGYAVLLHIVGELDHELGAGLLLAIVQRSETADHLDAVLGGNFAFRGHRLRRSWLFLAEIALELWARPLRMQLFTWIVRESQHCTPFPALSGTPPWVYTNSRTPCCYDSLPDFPTPSHSRKLGWGRLSRCSENFVVIPDTNVDLIEWLGCKIAALRVRVRFLH